MEKRKKRLRHRFLLSICVSHSKEMVRCEPFQSPYCSPDVNVAKYFIGANLKNIKAAPTNE